MGAKGRPKTGGRQKGTPNKSTGQFHARLQELGIDLLEEIKILLRDESPQAPSKQAKLTALTQMLAYIYPTRKALALTPEQEKVLQDLQEMSDMADDDINKLIEHGRKIYQEATASQSVEREMPAT